MLRAHAHEAIVPSANPFYSFQEIDTRRRRARAARRVRARRRDDRPLLAQARAPATRRLRAARSGDARAARRRDLPARRSRPRRAAARAGAPLRPPQSRPRRRDAAAGAAAKTPVPKPPREAGRDEGRDEGGDGCVRRVASGAPRAPDGEPVEPIDAGRPLALRGRSRAARRADGTAGAARDPSPFHKLGIGRDATEEEIRSAYMRLAKETHPDRYAAASQAARDLAEQAFREVTRAFDLLTDPVRLAKYREDPNRDRKEAQALDEAQRAIGGGTRVPEGRGASALARLVRRAHPLRARRRAVSRRRRVPRLLRLGLLPDTRPRRRRLQEGLRAGEARRQARPRSREAVPLPRPPVPGGGTPRAGRAHVHEGGGVPARFDRGAARAASAPDAAPEAGPARPSAAPPARRSRSDADRSRPDQGDASRMRARSRVTSTSGVLRSAPISSASYGTKSAGTLAGVEAAQRPVEQRRELRVGERRIRDARHPHQDTRGRPARAGSARPTCERRHLARRLGAVREMAALTVERVVRLGWYARAAYAARDRQQREPGRAGGSRLGRDAEHDRDRGLL